MNITAETFTANPRFKPFVAALEQPAVSVIRAFLKLGAEEQRALRDKLAPVAERLKGRSLGADEIPADLADRLGFGAQDQARVAKAAQALAESLGHDASKARPSELDKQRLEAALRDAVRSTGFAEKVTTRLTAQGDIAGGQLSDGGDAELRDCVAECQRIYLIELGLALVLFAAAAGVCLLISILTVGFGSGPCFAVATALLVSGVAAATASYLTCISACKGLS